jgi:hypothetical protein
VSVSEPGEGARVCAPYDLFDRTHAALTLPLLRNGPLPLRPSGRGKYNLRTLSDGKAALFRGMIFSRPTDSADRAEMEGVTSTLHRLTTTL